METLPIQATKIKPREETCVYPELHTHHVRCLTCRSLVYSTGQHHAGSEFDRLGLERAERMAKGHAEHNRGHRTQVYLNADNIAGTAFVYADEGVRA